MLPLPSVVFLGTPEIALPTLELLSKGEVCRLLFTITQPSRPAGRGQKISPPAVALYCQENKLDYAQTENINHDLQLLIKLETLRPDIILVFAFGQFLGTRLLSLPQMGCFNIHTSLLPKYRGAAPIQHALLKGDAVTGVTIQRMVKKMDAGDICQEMQLPIDPQDNCLTLTRKLSLLAQSVSLKFLSEIKLGLLTFSPQDESLVTFAPIIKKEEGRLDFKFDSAQTCLNKIRAYFPWPSAFCFINGKRLKVLKACISTQNLRPGEVSFFEKKINIGCSTGSLFFSEVQPEGKKACTSEELLNGIKGQIEIS